MQILEVKETELTDQKLKNYDISTQLSQASSQQKERKKDQQSNKSKIKKLQQTLEDVRNETKRKISEKDRKIAELLAVIERRDAELATKPNTIEEFAERLSLLERLKL